MPTLTKSEYNRMNKAQLPPNEASDVDKKALITRVYSWQQAQGIYAWDEDALREEDALKDISINSFILAGLNETGDPIEVEFLQPLDEDVDYEGVACGYRLIMLQQRLYTLQRYRKSSAESDAEGDPTETLEEAEDA